MGATMQVSHASSTFTTLALMLLVANLANTKNDAKNLKDD